MGVVLASSGRLLGHKTRRKPSCHKCPIKILVCLSTTSGLCVCLCLCVCVCVCVCGYTQEREPPRIMTGAAVQARTRDFATGPEATEKDLPRGRVCVGVCVWVWWVCVCVCVCVCLFTIMNDKDEEMWSVMLRRVRDRERESRQSYNCVANRLFHICPQEGSIDQQKGTQTWSPYIC